MSITLMSFVSDPKHMDEYRAWRMLPITQEIVQILEAAAAPAALDVTKAPGDLPNQALYLLGYNVGASHVLQTITSIEEVAAMYRMAAAREAVPSGYAGDGLTKGT